MTSLFTLANKAYITHERIFKSRAFLFSKKEIFEKILYYQILFFLIKIKFVYLFYQNFESQCRIEINSDL